MAWQWQCQVSSFFFLYISFVISFQQYPLCDPKESFALLDFKKAFLLDESPPYDCGQAYLTPYPKTTTWNESTDCCLWDGVECDKKEEDGHGHVHVHVHVIGLNLSCSLLHGNLHPNSSLFTLSHLQTLILSFNHFSYSPLPSQFGSFTNLRVLDLSWSKVGGDVPLEISHLSNLLSLHLFHNYFLSFSNVVMNQLLHNLTNLRDLDLTYINLSGIKSTSFMNFSLSLDSLRLSFCQLTANFPDYILGLPNLRELNLYYNTELKGHLPISNWSKSLEWLDLYSTNFSGGIPSSIGEANNLRYADLSYSNFNGEVPELVGNLKQPSSSDSFSNLMHLDLRHNSFIGAIPSWIYALPNLKSLFLSYNKFSGFMRDFRSNSLQNLHLRGNYLQGEISESIYEQMNLATLGLGSNNLSGVLNLDMLLSIQSLTHLELSYSRQLSIFSTNVTSANLVSIYMDSIKLEKFPYFLRYQKNLTTLVLSNNQIRGEIPKWVSEFGALSYLDLSHNFLSSGIEVLLTLPNLNYVFLDFNWFNKLPNLFQTSTMKYFSVSNNKLSGNIPSSICKSTNLTYLELSDNSLSGVISSCLCNMTNLQYLMLQRNNFSGAIPPMPPRISYYIASDNQFTGEIPPSICLAPQLSILSLSNNHLSATIPPCLANMTSLLVLDLKSNNFVGSVPTIFSTGCRLSSLDLNDNQIEGELPQSLMHCEYLQVLDLGNNKMTGHFPHWLLEAASSLQVLILRWNRFYGHINNSMNKYSFLNLRIMDLSHNNFTGSLPSNLFLNLIAMKDIAEVGNVHRYNIYHQGFWMESTFSYHDSLVVTLKGWKQKLEKIVRAFKAIDLSSNDFSGEIPKSIGMLMFLKGLNLSHNKLTGEIPVSFDNLTNLEALDLSSNKLLGNIPPQLASLTFLSVLNLSQNQLSGPIPRGTQFDTFENSSYVGNLGLCGFPLPKCDSDQDDQDHKSQLVDEEDSLGKEFWLRVVFMGYGCGMVFGIFVGYLVFLIGKPVWIVAKLEGKRATRIQTQTRNQKKYRPKTRNN